VLTVLRQLCPLGEEIDVPERSRAWKDVCSLFCRWAILSQSKYESPYYCYMYPVLMDRLKLCTNTHSYDCSTMILSHNALPEEPNRSMIRSTDFV
jgi:hypothetical protein